MLKKRFILSIFKIILLIAAEKSWLFEVTLLHILQQILIMILLHVCIKVKSSSTALEFYPISFLVFLTRNKVPAKIRERKRREIYD